MTVRFPFGVDILPLPYNTILPIVIFPVEGMTILSMFANLILATSN
jgi:hypothetical protein